MADRFDLVIIGAGPTGISCAIEAQKAGLDYIVLEKGFLVNSIYIFPTNMSFFSTSERLEIGGVPFISHTEKPTRMEALEYYRRITSSYKLKIRYNTEVKKVDALDGLTQVHSGDNDVFKTKNLIIATGYYDHPRMLDVQGEDLPKVKHYYDDAHPYIDKNVLVVGAANSACDVALETWQKGAKVTMAVREDQLYEKVKYWILPNIKNRIKEGSITAYFNTEVSKINLKSVVLDTPEGKKEIENDYVLAMTGYKPDFAFLRSVGIDFEDTEAQKPILNPETLESNIKNIYLAGVIVSGLKTSELFIENTRKHGLKIIKDILRKAQSAKAS